MKDILDIADIVLKKFNNNEPNITKCFVKSDNAGCYHHKKLYLKYVKRMELTYCSMTSMNLAKARINVIEKVQLPNHL